jgi:hypothetical protein
MLLAFVITANSTVQTYGAGFLYTCISDAGDLSFLFCLSIICSMFTEVMRHQMERHSFEALFFSLEWLYGVQSVFSH